MIVLEEFEGRRLWNIHCLTEVITITPNTSEVFINKHDFRKLKKLFNECRQMQLIPFLLNKRNIGEHVLAYFKLTQGYTRLLGSKKVRISYQFYFFHHIFVYNQCIKFTKLPNTSLESWPKNLSNEYIYAEQNPNRTRDISFQSWRFRSQSRLGVPPMFWLWGQVPKKWQVTRGFWLWFFLSWGIYYWKKSSETKFERITSRNFYHPISHCAMKLKMEKLESKCVKKDLEILNLKQEIDEKKDIVMVILHMPGSQLR